MKGGWAADGSSVSDRVCVCVCVCERERERTCAHTCEGIRWPDLCRHAIVQPLGRVEERRCRGPHGERHRLEARPRGGQLGCPAPGTAHGAGIRRSVHVKTTGDAFLGGRCVLCVREGVGARACERIRRPEGARGAIKGTNETWTCRDAEALASGVEDLRWNLCGPRKSKESGGGASGIERVSSYKRSA